MESFLSLYDYLQDRGIVPDLDNTEIIFVDQNYQDEWAQINWYQWMTFDHSEHFLFFSDISFDTPAATPNYSQSGCGIVLADGETVADGNLTATIRMDGNVWLYGSRRQGELSYGHYRYGPVSTKGTHRFAVVQDGDHVMVFVDEQPLIDKTGVVTTMGNGVGLVTMSGTNKGYGTRCIYDHIYYLTWD